MNLSEVILWTLIGYLFGTIIGGENEGVPGRFHWQWFIDKTSLHLHHWLIASMFLFVYISLDGEKESIYGFLIGCIIHGLGYNDWYVIIED